MTTENNGMYMPVVPQGYGYGGNGNDMFGGRGRGMNGRYVSRDYGPRSYSYGPDYYAGPDFYGPHYPMR